VKTFTVCFFLLISLQISSQEILTIRQVFDFEVGDEFHYRNIINEELYSSFSPNADRFTVINKYYSSTSDTLFYTFSQDSYYTKYIADSIPPKWPKVFFTDTILLAISSLDSSILFFDKIEYGDTIYHWIDFPWYFYDTIQETTASLCNTEVTGFECATDNFEPDVHLKKYGKGVGLVRYARILSPAPTFYYDYRLFYYKKGDEICGTPDITSETNVVSFESVVQIFPNPTDNFFVIKPLNGLQSAFSFEMHDLQGKVVIYRNNNIGELFVDVSGLSRGYYLLKIVSENKVFPDKILIE